MTDLTGDGKSGSKLPTREKLYTRWGQLKSERATWIAHWKEISDYLLPRNGRFFIQDRDKGHRRHNNIYDSTGTRALRVLAAGMMSGMTSPARPWFRLTTSHPELDQVYAVKVWLSQVQRQMLEVFQKSNTYRALHQMYEELGAFGTAASIVLQDFDNVIHHYVLTTGEYCIATDFQGNVCTLYREFQKTVGEVVKEFGIENVCCGTRSLYEAGSLDQWITIVHAIEPRADRDPSKKDDKNMPYASIYFELNGEKGKYLRESGFKRFCVLAPRWATAGGDIYGNSPAMEALGDIKQLQHEQLRKSQGIDYKTKPPIQVPTSMKNRDVDVLPAGISYVDMSSPTGGIRPAFEVNIDLSHLLEDIRDVRGRIEGSFYADLFLMISNSTNTNMTATEVAERHEEKLLMLGPVLERLQNEMLDPLIELTFEYMLDAGILPPAPEELQGMNINVEFVSMLAQAQRAIGTNSIDRFVNNLGALAQIKPEVLDKLDSDKWADKYADMLGVDPELLLDEKLVQDMRSQRAAQQAQMQRMAEAQATAETTQKLASADMSSSNALTNVLNQYSGYGSPAPQDL